MRSEEAIEHERDAPTCDMLMAKGWGLMNPRLLFSVALIAVLFCFWLIMTRPMCRDGLVASLGPRLDWSCLADDR